MIRTAATLLFLLITVAAVAQLVEYPLPRNFPTKSGRQFTRTQATQDPTFLPFFDDFSSSDTQLRDTLWLYGNSVLLNNGIGIKPPSRNVVTFDGADSLGKPYNVNDVLAKGFADRLTSQPIRMDLVPVPERGTVYISFFYQLKGNGEIPDQGDALRLAIKAQDGTWETVFEVEESPSTPTDVFQQVIIPVSDDRFFHDNFQFRFFNYARLSGRYDTWNLDYIYLNKGRSPADNRYPDRTISSPITSLFQEYFAMPVHHFLSRVSANLTAPKLVIYNMLEFNVNNGDPHKQPINYDTEVVISTTIDSVTTPSPSIQLNLAEFVGELEGLSYDTITLKTLPDSAYFNQNADSIHIQLSLKINTKDNVLLIDSGDYDPVKYSPIDFRYNDTLTANYVLSDYYAYDDGTAEYVAGLNQAGSYLAFQFTSRIDSVDTISYVDIYFPEFGDNTNQSLLLQIRSQLTDPNLPPLFEQLIVVNRTTMDKFTRYNLYRPVLVSGTFYIGWKQITNASIVVGNDKNTDNGNKVYYNVTGDWVLNTLVHGSIMVRPGFGSGAGTITALEKEPAIPRLYPNPAQGSCTVNGRVERLEVFDLTGRLTGAHWEPIGDETRITFSPGTSGLVLVRMLVNGRVYTQKIIVKGQGW